MLRHPHRSVIETCDACLRWRVLHSSIQRARHASSSSEPARIPPESPQFIHIPRSPQQSNVVVRNMKGTLPVPRKVFKKHEDKLSKTFLANTTPEPFLRDKTAATATSPEVKDWIKWKSAGAAMRRMNLREGLFELRRRENRTNRREAKVSKAKQAEHDHAVSAPETEDERLSRPSILEFMNFSQASQQDKEMKAKIFQERKARYAALQIAKADEKQTALHTLYVNAKDFIVTHDQLEKKITEAFESGFYRHRAHENMGIWDEEGFPENTAYLLAATNQASGPAVEQGKGYSEVTRSRLQRIAEELTGGKMEES